MNAHQRSAGLGLIAALACLTAALTTDVGRLWADPHVAPGRTAQLIIDLPPGCEAPPPCPAPPVPLAPPEGEPPCAAELPTPVVKLYIRAPAAVSAGQEVEYRICVENCSHAPAHHVVVTDALPANARFVRARPEPALREPDLVWRLGTLEGCGCREISLVLAPIGPGDIQNCARVQFEHGQCVTTRVTRPELTLEKKGPDQAILYDAVTYQLIVTNVGGAEATNVLLTDTLPEGLEHQGGKMQRTWDLGTLAPGQSQRVEYQVIAKKAGEFRNVAAVVAAGGLRKEASHVLKVIEARIELNKTGPERHYLNHPATYQITAINAGAAPLENVIIKDPLPPQTTFVSATEGGRFADNQVQWTLGTLAPGVRRTVQVVLRAQAAGEVINRATISAERGLTAQAEARTLFEGATGLTGDVDVKDNPVEVGTTTTYTITVINQGNIPTTHVGVTALVPEQMEVTDAKGPTTGHRDGQKVTFDPVPVLQPGAALTYEIFVKAQRAGDVRFKVDITADQLPAGPVHREVGTTIYSDVQPARPLPPGGV